MGIQAWLCGKAGTVREGRGVGGSRMRTCNVDGFIKDEAGYLRHVHAGAGKLSKDKTVGCIGSNGLLTVLLSLSPSQ